MITKNMLSAQIRPKRPLQLKTGKPLKPRRTESNKTPTHSKHTKKPATPYYSTKGITWLTERVWAKREEYKRHFLTLSKSIQIFSNKKAASQQKEKRCVWKKENTYRP